MEDDGEVLISGVNPFDTDMQTFRFQPNANGGFEVSTVTFNFDSDLGTNLNLGDDENAIRNIPFTFNYFGNAFTQVHINANGIVSFGSNVNPSGFFDDNDFFNELPKIAPYFMDLNPVVSGDVFFKSEGEKITITWNEITEFSQTGSPINLNTFQLVLRPDGSFDVSFNGIGATTQINNRPITFGIHPDGQPTLEIISFSDDLPFSGTVKTGIFENYLDIEQPIVNDTAVMNKFYEVFPDSFFQTAFFTNFTQTMAGFANEVNIKNHIQGIGLRDDLDISEFFGSNRVLESRLNMNQLNVWPDDPTRRFFGGGNNFLTIMGQEAGHRWGAFVNFIDANGNRSNLILGRADAHWSFFFDADHSSLEGGNWEPLSGDTFTTPTQIDFFGDIDEYIFGVRGPQEVTPSFFVSSASNNLPFSRARGTPLQGTTARGTAVEVTIQDIIAAEGPRFPAEPNAPKDLRQAFILIVEAGTSPTQAELDKMSRFRRTWEDYFEVSVDGRMTLNTSIVRTFPIAVVRGHVLDAVTKLPLQNISVKSVERGFVQFVPSTGRYTFRYMAHEESGSEEQITLIADAEGYAPDTVATSIAYGTELEVDFELNPNPTAVEDVQTNVPSAYALLQNYPNPFNPSTQIRYELQRLSQVQLTVYNMLGQEVAILVNERQPAGSYAVKWQGDNVSGEIVANGVYLLQFEAEDVSSGTGQVFVETRKMVLLR